MADNAIASTGVIIKANADQLASGLNQAKGKVENFGRETTKKLGETGKTGGREFAKSFGADLAQEVGRRSFFGGILGGLAGGGLAGGASELLANTLGFLVDPIKDLVTGATQLAEASARHLDNMREASRETDRGAKLAEEWRRALTDDEAGRFANMESLAAQLSQRNTEFRNLRDSMIEPARPMSVEHPDVWREFYRAHDAWEARMKNKASVDARLTELEGEINGLAERWDRLADRAKDPAFVGEINKAAFALQIQAEMWGKSGTAAEKAMFKFRGATDDMLKGLDEADAKLKKLAESNTIPPWLNMTLGAAGMAAHRAMPQELPGFDLMLSTLSRVAGALPKGVGLEDWVRGALDPMQGLAPFLSGPLGAATAIAEAFQNAKGPQDTLAGAFEKGSREAYSIVAKGEGGMMGDKAVAAVKEGNNLLGKAVDHLEGIKKMFGEIEEA